MDDDFDFYENVSAYCLMIYCSEGRSEMEVVWNSRDGKVPNYITLRSGKSAVHEYEIMDQATDEDFEPLLGTRVFIDLTRERFDENMKYTWENNLNGAQDYFPNFDDYMGMMGTGFTEGTAILVSAEEYLNTKMFGE